MNDDSFELLNTRINELEIKVDRIIHMFERLEGGWAALKWLGATVAGAVAIWAFLTDHIKFH